MRRLAFAAAGIFSTFLAITAASAAPPVRVLYVEECAACHGMQGNGKGVADPALSPPPRDFTRGKFKLRSTDPQQPISEAELVHTITEGIPGTAMPSFRYLPPGRIRELAAYVRHLARLDGKESGAPIAIPTPPAVTPALIADGKKLYNDLGCPACHGKEAKGDGAASPMLKDEWGAADPARDLTQSPYRGGDRLEDVYLRLTAGIPGTPMPGYGAVTTDRERWAVAAYLESIRQPIVPPPTGNPAKLGEIAVSKYQCLACHQLKGSGGKVGPPLDGVTGKLRPEWLKNYLANPRRGPKVYLTHAYRMPQQFLSRPEIDGILVYLSKLDGPSPAAQPAKPATDAAAQRQQGEKIFQEQCKGCHTLDNRATAVLSKYPAPDLSRARDRLQENWLLNWAQTHPGHEADVPKLSDADVAAVRVYVWSAK